MVRFTLEQLTNDVATKPKTADRLFLYHTSNNRYGPAAAAAIGVPETARTYLQNNAIATARTAFEAERRNPAANEVLLRTYLSDYNQDMNREGWNRGKNIAKVLGAAGLALLVWSFVADAETARKIGRVAGVASEVGAGVRLLRDYLMYRA